MKKRKVLLIAAAAVLCAAWFALRQASAPEMTERPVDRLLAELSQGTEGKEIQDITYSTVVQIDDQPAEYQMIYGEAGIDDGYLGEAFAETEAGLWYRLEGGMLDYLIFEEREGARSLWMFDHFLLDGWTYGEAFAKIYGLNSAEDIHTITTKPNPSNNTLQGQAWQAEVGVHTYDNRQEIETFWQHVSGLQGHPDQWNTYQSIPYRYTYSFSVEAQDEHAKLDSGEETLGTRRVILELKDGTVIEGLFYSALKGCIWQYGGICSEPMRDEAVEELNGIFAIE